MKQKMWKVFGEDVEGFQGGGNRTVFGIRVEDLELTVTHLKGRPPVPEEVFWVLLNEYADEIRLAEEYERSNPFKVRSWNGSSGCTDYYVDHLVEIEGYTISRSKPVYHVSMYGKLNEDMSCFLPDLIEVIRHIDYDPVQIPYYPVSEPDESEFTSPDAIRTSVLALINPRVGGEHSVRRWARRAGWCADGTADAWRKIEASGLSEKISGPYNPDQKLTLEELSMLYQKIQASEDEELMRIGHQIENFVEHTK